VTILAEEILIKASKTYLGWKISENQFKTCRGTQMEIGNGQIEMTDRKCPETPGPIVVVKEVRWHGTLVRFSKDTSSIDVRKGAVEKKIYFDSSTKWTKGAKTVDMSELKEGSDVICLGKYDKKGAFHATRIDVRR
jgi:hypothetical protein